MYIISKETLLNNLDIFEATDSFKVLTSRQYEDYLLSEMDPAFKMNWDSIELFVSPYSLALGSDTVPALFNAQTHEGEAIHINISTPMAHIMAFIV
jgi:hypothetical protein